MSKLAAVALSCIICLSAHLGCIPARVRNGALFGIDKVKPPMVRVRLQNANTTHVLRGEGRIVINAFDGRNATPSTFSTEDSITIKHISGGIEVVTGEKVRLTRDASGVSVHPDDPTQLIRLNGLPYHGALVFGRFEENPIVVNRLNIDTYLMGVLAPELGERTTDEFEAVKGQAVAARTYALRHLGQYGFAPYDLKADVSDQVYVGASQQRDWVDSAVIATRGEVLRYDGDLIEAYYHSTCGGRTDAIEDVWPKPARPYLVSVDDSTFCSWSRYWRWKEEFGGKQLRLKLQAYRKESGADVRAFRYIKDITLNDRTPGGRLRSITVATSGGNWTIRADQIRWALGRSSRPGSILPSSNFDIDLRHNSSGNISQATVTGRGYGHGVGMCQIGMIGRARAGQVYREILPHYYMGTEIETVY